MSLIIENGDFKTNARGIPVDASDAEFAFSAAECMLKMPRGSFFYDPDMGSRIPEMEAIPRENADALALEYAAEATQGIEGISVSAARVCENGKSVIITLKFGAETKEVSIDL